MYTFASCQTFAGGFDMGMVQAGHRFVHKVEQAGGFGMKNCVVNQHLLGPFTWEVGDYQSWHAPQVDILAANPPCSGFSVMTDSKSRGVDAKINSCMWALMHYAARVKPTVVIMESVRPAFTGGRDLMLALRADLEARSGLRYNLFHVMQDALELGGAARRPRYFWTAVREELPFGLDYPVVRQPAYHEIIGDLQDLALTWNAQPYRRPATWWSQRSARTHHTHVDGHQVQSSLPVQRALDLLEAAEDCGVGWPPGKWIGWVAQRVYEKTGKLPDTWTDKLDKLIAKDFHMGFTSLTRWDPEKPARVITGGALQLSLHPYEPRTITHREAARIMGFPDDWLIKPLRGASALPMTWGKGITVQCGKWIGDNVRNALDGRPGQRTGVSIGDREWVISPPTSKTRYDRLKQHLTTPSENLEGTDCTSFLGVIN